MKRFVLDCSVSAAWCLADETSERARAYLGYLGEGEALVPALWTVEMTNVLVQAERRKRISRDDLLQAISLLERLPIVVTDASAGDMAELYELASRHSLSAYDAAYLQLSARRNLPLATVDRQLRAAARSVGAALL